MLIDYADLQKKTIVFKTIDYPSINAMYTSVLNFLNSHNIILEKSYLSEETIESILNKELYYSIEKAVETNVVYSYAKRSNYVPFAENDAYLTALSKYIYKPSKIVKTFVRNGKKHYITEDTLRQYTILLEFLKSQANNYTRSKRVPISLFTDYFTALAYSPFKQANLYSLLECSVYSQEYANLLHPFIKKYLEKLPDAYKKVYGLKDEDVLHLVHYKTELKDFYEYIETGNPKLFLKLRKSNIKKFLSDFGARTKRFLAKNILCNEIDLNCLNLSFFNLYKDALYNINYKIVQTNNETLLKTACHILSYSNYFKTSTIINKKFAKKFLKSLQENKNIPNYYFALTKSKASINGKEDIQKYNLKVVKESIFSLDSDNVVKLANSHKERLHELKKIPVLLLNNYSYKHSNVQKTMFIVFYEKNGDLILNIVTPENYINITRFLTSKVPIK